MMEKENSSNVPQGDQEYDLDMQIENMDIGAQKISDQNLWNIAEETQKQLQNPNLDLKVIDADGNNFVHTQVKNGHVLGITEMGVIGATYMQSIFDKPNKEGLTPLALAVTSKNINPTKTKALVEELIKFGADITTEHNGVSAIDLALKSKDKELIKALVSNRDSTGRLYESRIKRPVSLEALMIRAIERNDFEGANLYQELGANVKEQTVQDALKQHINKVGEDGKTPLIKAIETGNIDTAKALVEMGADINKPDKGKLHSTPIQYLITLHVQSGLQNKQGQSFDEDKILKLKNFMFEHGADLYKKNSLGRSASESLSSMKQQVKEKTLNLTGMSKLYQDIVHEYKPNLSMQIKGIFSIIKQKLSMVQEALFPVRKQINLTNTLQNTAKDSKAETKLNQNKSKQRASQHKQFQEKTGKIMSPSTPTIKPSIDKSSRSR